MKNALCVLLLILSQFLMAESIRIYFSLDIDTDPINSELSIKTGPLMGWEYVGKSPHSMILFRDLPITDFMLKRDYYRGQIVYYSNRYGSGKIWPYPGELFSQLRKDYCDDIIKDLGFVSTGWIMAEQEGYETTNRTLSLNGNIEHISFDRSTAENNPNSLRIPLKEKDNYGHRNFHETMTVDISSDPPNCAVYSNEDYIGKTPCRITIRWKSPQSRKEIRFEKSGYITNRRMITPEEERIHVVLQPMR